jgi:predicted regulator of Ras-like GTPase activity (Roadblock/LC7/MglB family)
MDAPQALADLTEISSQIESAVILDAAGAVLASTFPDEARGERLARAAGALVEAAAEVRSGTGEPLTQLEAATREGSVFVVVEESRRIAATTGPGPTVGLVFYDLKSCLRQLDEEDPKPKPKPRARAKPKPRAKKADDAP